MRSIVSGCAVTVVTDGVSLEQIREPFQYSDNGEEGNDNPFHPRRSSRDVDSPDTQYRLWDHRLDNFQYWCNPKKLLAPGWCETSTEKAVIADREDEDAYVSNQNKKYASDTQVQYRALAPVEAPFRW